MPAILPLLMTALMAGGVASGFLKKQTAETNYTRLPTAADANVLAAGTEASRRARGASGLPDGGKWQSAGGFLSTMPGLIGR